MLDPGSGSGGKTFLNQSKAGKPSVLLHPRCFRNQLLLGVMGPAESDSNRAVGGKQLGDLVPGSRPVPLEHIGVIIRLLMGEADGCPAPPQWYVIQEWYRNPFESMYVTDNPYYVKAISLRFSYWYPAFSWLSDFSQGCAWLL